MPSPEGAANSNPGYLCQTFSFRAWQPIGQGEPSMPQIVRKSEEQKDAEAEVESFQQNLGPFVIAAETTRMPMVFTDAIEPKHHIIFANDSFLKMTGYAREEVLGQDFTFLLAGNAKAEVLKQIEVEFGNETEDRKSVV